MIMLKRMLASVAIATGRLRQAAERIVALAMYRRRRRVRFNKNFPVRWRSQSSLIYEDVKVISEVDGKDAISPALIDQAISAQRELEAAIAKRTASSTILFAYLLLTSFGLEVPVSIAGFQLATVPGLNEIVLVVASAISASMIPHFVNLHTLNAFMRSAIEEVYLSSVVPIYRSIVFRTEIPRMYIPAYMPHITWSTGKFIINAIAIVLMVLLVLFLLAFYLITRYYIYGYIIESQSVDSLMSYGAVGVSLALDLSLFFFAAIHFAPLPVRDWTLLQQMEIADQLDPVAAERLKAQTYADDVADEFEMRRKGFIPPSK